MWFPYSIISYSMSLYYDSSRVWRNTGKLISTNGNIYNSELTTYWQCWTQLVTTLEKCTLWIPKVRTRGTKLLDDPGSGEKERTEIRGSGGLEARSLLHVGLAFALDTCLAFTSIVPPLFQKQKQTPWILTFLPLMNRGSSWYRRTDWKNKPKCGEVLRHLHDKLAYPKV